MVGAVNVRKKKVALIFGGRSGEHIVSLMSAASVMKEIDRDKYEIFPVGITREGKWLTSDDIWQTLWENKSYDRAYQLLLKTDPKSPGFWIQVGTANKASECLQIDIAFPLLHGPYGEDGTIQGLLEMIGIPYVGSGVLASSLGMDKVIMKTLFREAGLPVVPFVSFDRTQWMMDKKGCMENVGPKIGYPCFVKPANLGSSVGISKVNEGHTLKAAIEEAFLYDEKIIIEAFADGREIECSVIGDLEVEASLPGEIIPGHDFYSYNAKYVDDTTKLIIPANLEDDIIKKVQEYSCKAFRVINGSGLARVDFFVKTSQNKLWVNEINTIPGFTKISMYPKLWEASGLSYKELINRLLQVAETRFKRRRALRFTPPE